VTEPGPSIPVLLIKTLTLPQRGRAASAIPWQSSLLVTCPAKIDASPLYSRIMGRVVSAFLSSRATSGTLAPAWHRDRDGLPGPDEIAAAGSPGQVTMATLLLNRVHVLTSYVFLDLPGLAPMPGFTP
jgi:hypothetical protein